MSVRRARMNYAPPLVDARSGHEMNYMIKYQHDLDLNLPATPGYAS